jgi:hypothetical protein
VVFPKRDPEKFELVPEPEKEEETCEVAPKWLSSMCESARFVETTDDPREPADSEFPPRAPRLPPRAAGALERPGPPPGRPPPPPPPWKPPPPPPCCAEAKRGAPVNPITTITANKSLKKVDFVICLSSKNCLNCCERRSFRAMRLLDLTLTEPGTNAACLARIAHRDSALRPEGIRTRGVLASVPPSLKVDHPPD